MSGRRVWVSNLDPAALSPQNNKQTEPNTMSKTIAILSKTAGLAGAIEALITPRVVGARFVVVEKLKDVPSDAYAIASFQMPSFLPSTAGTRVMVVGTRMTSDDEDRKAQFALIRNAAATAEDIIPELGNVDEVIVIGSRHITNLRLGLAEHRATIAETPSDDLAAQLAAYKAAYEYLKAGAPGLA